MTDPIKDSLYAAAGLEPPQSVSDEESLESPQSVSDEEIKRSFYQAAGLPTPQQEPTQQISSPRVQSPAGGGPWPTPAEGLGFLWNIISGGGKEVAKFIAEGPEWMAGAVEVAARTVAGEEDEEGQEIARKLLEAMSGFGPDLGPLSELSRLPEQVAESAAGAREKFEERRLTVYADLLPFLAEPMPEFADDPGTWLGGNIGRGLATAATAAGTGLLGQAAGAAAGVGATAGAFTGAFTSMWGLEASGMFQELVEGKGMDPDEAAPYATAYGAVAGALEFFPLIRLARMMRRVAGVGVDTAATQLVKGVRSDLLTTMGKEALKQGGVEGLEEISQGYAAVITRVLAGVESDLISWDIAKDLLSQGFIGWLVGGLLGGGGGAYSFRMNQAVREAVEAVAAEPEGDVVATFRTSLVEGGHMSEEGANFLISQMIGAAAEASGMDIPTYLRNYVNEVIVAGKPTMIGTEDIEIEGGRHFQIGPEEGALDVEGQVLPLPEGQEEVEPHAVRRLFQILEEEDEYEFGEVAGQYVAPDGATSEPGKIDKGMLKTLDVAALNLEILQRGNPVGSLRLQMARIDQRMGEALKQRGALKKTPVADVIGKLYALVTIHGPGKNRLGQPALNRLKQKLKPLIPDLKVLDQGSRVGGKSAEVARLNAADKYGVWDFLDDEAVLDTKARMGFSDEQVPDAILFHAVKRVRDLLRNFIAVNRMDENAYAEAHRQLADFVQNMEATYGPEIDRILNLLGQAATARWIEIESQGLIEYKRLFRILKQEEEEELPLAPGTAIPTAENLRERRRAGEQLPEDVRTAFQLASGEVIQAPDSRPLMMHLLLLEEHEDEIDVSDIVSSGFTVNGKYVKRLPDAMIDYLAEREREWERRRGRLEEHLGEERSRRLKGRRLEQAVPEEPPAAAAPTSIDTSSFIEAQAEWHAQEGGSTFDARTGENKDGQRLWLVAYYRERNEQLDHQPTAAELDDYVQRHADVLSQEGNYFGTWLDKKTGRVHLDVSKGFPNARDAVAAARRKSPEEDEIAIFNIADFRELITKRKIFPPRAPQAKGVTRSLLPTASVRRRMRSLAKKTWNIIQGEKAALQLDAVIQEELAQLQEPVAPGEEVTEPRRRVAWAFSQAVAEIKHWFDNVEYEDTGLDWYTIEREIAIDDYIDGGLLPELVRTNPSWRTLFNTLVGIFSPVRGVPQQEADAIDAMDQIHEQFIRTGKVVIPSTKDLTKKPGGGEKFGISSESVRLLNSMIERMGFEQAMEWLNDPTLTVADLRRMKIKHGQSGAVPGKANRPAIGYQIFGPKAGMFAANSAGLDVMPDGEPIITIDLWMSLWYHRLTGQLGEKTLSDIKSPTEGVRQEAMQLLTEMAAAYDVSPRDMQAVVWFYERALWSQMGKRKIEEGRLPVIAADLVEKYGQTERQRLEQAYEYRRGLQPRVEAEAAGEAAEPETGAGVRAGEAGGGRRAGSPDEGAPPGVEGARRESPQERQAGEAAPGSRKEGKGAAPAPGKEGKVLTQQQQAEERGGRKAKAAIIFDAVGKASIWFSENADVSSVVHEIAHLVLENLPGEARAPFESWLGDKVDQWTDEQHETFARAAELMLLTGEPPNARLLPAFTRLAEGMEQVYADAKELGDVDPPAHIRRVFEGVFATGKIQPYAGPEVEPVGRKKAKPAKKPTGKRVTLAVETEFQKARRGRSEENFIDRMKSLWRDHKNAISRMYKDIDPRDPFNATFIEEMRALENAHGPVAEYQVYNRLNNILGVLNSDQRNLFDQVTLLRHLKGLMDHLVPDDGELRLPFGYTFAEVDADLAKVEAAASKDSDVQVALQHMEDFWNEIRDQVRAKFEQAGLPTDFLDKQGDTYLHHDILVLADTSRGSKRIRAPLGMPFQRKLTGKVDKPINMNFEQAQGAVMVNLIMAGKMADTVRRLKEKYDILPALKRDAKRLDVTWQELLKRPQYARKYAAWYPKGPFTFYTTETLVDSAIMEIVTNKVAEVTGEDLRQVMAMVRANPMILPVEFIEVLDGKEKTAGKAAATSRQITKYWKAWAIASPFRIMRYMTRNLLGDVQMVLTWNPDSVKYMSKAFKELRSVLMKQEKPSRLMWEWIQRSGFSSGLTQQEYQDSQFDELGKLLADPKLREILRNPLKSWFRFTRKKIMLFESIMRYATFMSFVNQMKGQKDGKPRLGKKENWGASIPAQVMEHDDIYTRAYILSDELAGAYDMISEHGRAVRMHLYPFWSFKELNTRRHYRLLKNALDTDQIAMGMGKAFVGTTARWALKSPYTVYRAGVWLARATVFEAALMAINNMLFDDLEKDLPEDVRRSSHLLLGRNADGSVRYFNRFALFEEFRQWLGMEDMPYLVWDYLNGRLTKEQVAQRFIEETGPRAINTLVQGMGGPWKTFLEIGVGWSAYPDVFRPRRMESRLEGAAQALGMNNIYRPLAGRATRFGGKTTLKALLKTWPDLFFYTAVPGASQFWDNLGDRLRWQRSIGEDTDWNGASMSSKSIALRNFKRCLRSGQDQIAFVWLERYKEAGGTFDGAVQSLKMSHPTYGLDRREVEAYRAWLGDAGSERLDMAIRYWEDTYKLDRETRDLLIRALRK